MSSDYWIERPKMYEQTGCLDPNTMAEGSTSQIDIFPQTVPSQSPPPPPLMIAGNPTNSNNNRLEENPKLSMEELSHHHHSPPHPEEFSTFENRVDIIHPQHLGLNMENSFNNNNNLVLPFEQSTWDSNIQEPQDLGFANNHQQQQPHDQQFQQTEAQNCSQSYNSFSILDPSYHSQDLQNLLHFPTCSASSLHTNPIQEIPNFQHPVGFLGDLPIGSYNTSASTVLYDPQFHLNLPPHSPPLRELFQSLPQGYSLHHHMEGNGGVYQEGDGSQLDIGVLEFNTGSIAIGKGRKDTKHFASEKQRRDQWNDKYKVLRSLIPKPTKADRASIVGDAIEYVRELIRTVSELKLLVDKKRYGRERCKRHKTGDDTSESCNIKPFCDQDGCIRTSWLQRKSKDSEVDVRIIDDEVTVKLVQRKKINCLLFVSKVLDELQLDLHHVAGGHVGEYCSFLFNSKIIEGSSVYASGIANKVIEVMDTQYAAALPPSRSGTGGFC